MFLHCCFLLLQFEEAVGKLPDNKLPVASQLEQAISTIKANVRIILDTQADSKRLKQVKGKISFVCRQTIMRLRYFPKVKNLMLRCGISGSVNYWLLMR